MKPTHLLALTALAASLTLSACGDSETTASADGSEAAETVKVAATAATPSATETPVAAAEPEPEPEPEIDAVVAFRAGGAELELAAEHLVMVSPVRDETSDTWSVFIQMDKKPAEDFYELTSSTDAAALSVVVDGTVVSAPKIDSPIYGGGFVFEVPDAEIASSVIATLSGKPGTAIAIDTSPVEEPVEEQAAVEAPAETEDATAQN